MIINRPVKYLLAALLATLIAAYGIEFSLRYFSGQFLMPDIYDYDPVTFTRLKPNLALRHKTDDFDVTIRTDSHGWRSDYEINPIKRSGTKRLLFAGDSITFGWGVENAETYPSLIADKLRAGGLKNVEVINLSVPSFSGYSVAEKFKHEGVPLKPDVVCAVVFINNDFKENLVLYLLARSFPYKLLGPQIFKIILLARSSLIKSVSGYNSVVPHFLELRYLPYNGVNTALGMLLRLSIRLPDPDTMARIENNISLAYIYGLNASAKKAGIEPFFIILDIAARYPARTDKSARMLDIEGLLNEYFAGHKIKYVDLIAELRARHPEMYSLPSFRHDGHFTAEGHRLIADALYNSRPFRDLMGIKGAAGPRIY